MKYSKFIKENYHDTNSYLFLVMFTVILFILFLFFEVKGTEAGFSGNTAVITPPYKVIYSSNWPNESFGTNHIVEYGTFKNYTIIDNMFSISEEYEFAFWNTLADGTGDTYIVNDVITVDANIHLYAQWKLVNDSNLEEDQIPDENNGGSSGNIETGDDNVSTDDVIDEDLNDGGNITEEEKNDDTSDVGSSGSSASGNGGNGSSGSGNSSSSSGNSSSSGSSSENNASSSVGSSNNLTNSNGNNNSSNKGNTTNNNITSNDDNKDVVPKKYQFKFYNGDVEYTNTSCDVLDDGTCMMLLPSKFPSKDGFKFNGWSLRSDCLSDDIITSSISVNGSNNYYACFEVIVDVSNNNSWIYLVVSIWVIAGIIIYFLVKKFREKEIND